MRTRTLIETAAAAGAGVAATAVLYSDWWGECCDAAESVVTLAFLPGFLIGILLGGGVHSASRPLIYAGVAIEFVAVWFIFRFLAQKLRRKDRRARAA